MLCHLMVHHLVLFQAYAQAPAGSILNNSSPEPLRIFNLKFKSLHSLNYPQYRIFWIAAVFSCIGMWSLVFGRLWLMHLLNPEEYMLGLVTACSLGPMLFLSMWGGVIADRWNRRRLLIITRAIIALLVLITAIGVSLGIMTPLLLLTISFFTGVLLAFDLPARAAMLPNLLPKSSLLNGMVLYSMAISGSAILGPSLFGILASYLGISSIFYLIFLAYTIVVGLLIYMRPTANPNAKSGKSMGSDLKQGFQYLYGSKGILYLIIMGILMGVFGMSFETLLPAFAKLVFMQDVGFYSRLLLFLGVGGITSSICLAKYANVKNSLHIMLITGTLFALSLILFGFNNLILLSYIIIAFIGALAFAFHTINSTLVQMLTLDNFRGRVMSIHQLTWSSTSIGGFLLGLLASYYAPQPALMVFGAFTFISVTFCYVMLKSKIKNSLN
jgi:MFS family permease